MKTKRVLLGCLGAVVLVAAIAAALIFWYMRSVEKVAGDSGIAMSFLHSIESRDSAFPGVKLEAQREAAFKGLAEKGNTPDIILDRLGTARSIKNVEVVSVDPARQMVYGTWDVDADKKQYQLRMFFNGKRELYGVQMRTGPDEEWVDLYYIETESRRPGHTYESSKSVRKQFFGE